MIEICRCENALFSALSMSWTRTPRLEAVLRSIASVSCSPPGSRSLETSVMPSTLSMRLPTIGAHFCSRSRSGLRQRVLVVGIALPAAGADVLRREHEQPDAGDAIEILAQPVDHHLGRHARPLLRRLQADVHHPAIGAAAAGTAGAAQRRADSRHGRIGHHDIGELLLQLQHGLERGVGRRPGRADHEAGIVDREISLRGLDIEHHRQRDGGEKHDQGQERKAQHRPAASACRRRRCATACPRRRGRTRSR